MRTKPDFWTGEDRICWLCVLMESFVGVSSLEHAPALLSGMTSVYDAPTLRHARQAVLNLRQICPAYATMQSIKHAVTLYNEFQYQEKRPGPYRIDPLTMRFERTDPLEDPQIFKARTLLSEPLPYERHSLKMADPKREMAMQLRDDALGVRIPIGPIDAPLSPPRVHAIDRRPRGRIRVPLHELRAIAREMDARDAAHAERRRGNWEARLASFDVLAPKREAGLFASDIIELDEVRHLIGLPGAGKTTVLMLLAVWLGRHGHKTMMAFPSIEVARQYMADLLFHNLRVGMLVGQNLTTRQRHADRIADAIAAAGQCGFAHTLEGASAFAANCVLPAFSSADVSMWNFGEAPCERILQGTERGGRMVKRLCPVWTMCGRNQAPRELIDADIWVGHVVSMDTRLPSHALDQQLRYFELIARTFDVVVFDEADMVQDNLDAYGSAVLSISGSDDSLHRVIQEQIHNRFARGENYRLYDRNVETYSRDLNEFGNHNYTLISTVQNIAQTVSQRYADQLLTTSRVITELLDGFGAQSPKRDELDDGAVTHGFTIARAITDLWDRAAYTAFYDRIGGDVHEWPRADLCARTLGIDRQALAEKREQLVRHFRRYLAENSLQGRATIVRELTELFLDVCFRDAPRPHFAPDAVLLLIAVTFMILGYQRIVPRTRTMVADGLIREPIMEAAASTELRRFIPESILGSLSGVKYSFERARTTHGGAKNVELSYVSFIGAPRMLMHRINRLLQPDGGQPGPAVLLTSATSFFEASPAYHVNIGPDYVLRVRPDDSQLGTPVPPEQSERPRDRTRYIFKWIADRSHGDQPLRYSGAGELAERNLRRMVEELVRGGTTKSELYKSINNFDVRWGIKRKAALVVNSYQQARLLKRYLDNHHREIGRRTKAVVRVLEDGDSHTDYITSARAEALGDDDTCDIVIFPMNAIGRGVNIVFTRGPRARDGAIGSIYFLTRPHPSGDDMQLLRSLAGRAAQEFDRREFGSTEGLETISAALAQAKAGAYRIAHRLLQEPLQASRLGAELFRPFTANQMVAVLQTIGRGMRNGCPVAVYFVDSAWAPRSAMDKPDNAQSSMLVQMRLILEECMAHPDPVIGEIYRELYFPFLEPLRETERVLFPDDLRGPMDTIYEDDGFDDNHPLLET